ncbi:substrate-binding domain-containing protein [Salinarchaeum sp. IM2453]|uniref:substrate-binding domain-containing protein n=1 Tax=Salinarchaeum sp. IM2453 TaxID=2862870 RepID=UPI001C83DEF2|nr:substrate-binding domain-containing protein [Salinarchaeum sp. IM2453]QZA89374.1 substrate-binding domain-containing protein [Salinarchaeum sp. IM2453]
MAAEDTPRGGISRRNALTALSGIGVISLAGCTDIFGDDTIEASGSNTVRPLTETVAESFEDDYDEDISINVEGPGTGAGFESFTQGETDIQNASRAATDEELDDADDNDVEFTRFQVGQDALSVYINDENEFLDPDEDNFITISELGDIYEFESEVEQWSDVRDEWPDEEIDIWGRDSDSGTFDYFTEAVTGEAGNVRTDYNDRTETLAVVEGVEDSEFAIGFGGYAFLEEGDVMGAAVRYEEEHDEGEAYPPEPEAIEAGDYQPLTRPLFIFVNHDLFEEEHGRDFIRYYFDNVDEIAPEVDFFPAPEDVLEENHDKMDDILDDLGIDE